MHSIVFVHGMVSIVLSTCNQLWLNLTWKAIKCSDNDYPKRIKIPSQWRRSQSSRLHRTYGYNEVHRSNLHNYSLHYKHTHHWYTCDSCIESGYICSKSRLYYRDNHWLHYTEGRRAYIFHSNTWNGCFRSYKLKGMMTINIMILKFKELLLQKRSEKQ